MTSRGQIEAAVRSLYAARVRGDLEGTLKDFAPDAAFGLNGRGTNVAALSAPKHGIGAIKPIIKQLIDDWRFDDWQEHALLVDGERALLHWSAQATCVPTGKSARFEVYDLVTFRDGRIIDYRQSTDTAMIMALAS